MNQTRTGAAAAAFLCVLAAVASPRSALFEAPTASLDGVKILSTTPYVARKDDFLAGRGAGEFTRVDCLGRFRGGGETSTLVKVGAGLMAAHGAMHFISPVQGFKFYGVTDADALSLATLRNAGAWELGLAALFIMDPATVVARSNFVAGLSLLSYGPAYAEISGSPKEKYVFWIGVCAVLGLLAESGNVSPWVAPTLYGLNGLACYAFPQNQAKIYGLPELSPMQEGEFRLIGSALFESSAYLYALAAGKSQATAFAAAWTVVGLHCARVLVAEPVRHANLPIVGWIVTSVALVYAGLR